MHIHHLNCGTFCPRGKLFINGYGGALEAAKLVCHCQLVETREGLVLIDTGLGTQDIKDPDHSLPSSLWRAFNRPVLSYEETAIAQVKAKGFKPEDVRHIVVTHLDFDHAGGLADFPWAKVHVFRRELEEAMSRPTYRDRKRYAPRQFAHNPQWCIYETQGEDWFGFKAVRNLDGVDPDIVMVPLEGHSAGHCGVAVNTEYDWILNCGDAVFSHGEIDGPDRCCPLGLRIYQNIFQYDRSMRMENQKRLRELVHMHGEEIEVFCSHDPEMMTRFANRATERLPPSAYQAAAPGEARLPEMSF